MKREPRWVGPFLKGLGRTGNVRLAAEGAGVDFTTAYQRRKRHAEFAERWDGALGAFGSAQESLRSGQALEVQASALDRAPSTIPSAGNGPPPRPGEELVGRPDGKLVKASEARWGKAAEEAFLVELTVSGSVRLAAKAAGFSTQALYKQRIKDRRFAAAWDAAIETGKARVQAYLVEAATRTFDPDELPIGDDREIPKVSIGEAINIARLKGAASTLPGMDGADYGEGEFVTHQQIEEARQRILERLERIEDNVAEHERVSGCCHQCGQPLPAEEGGPKHALPRARFLLLDGPGA
jgi:hypothetical protein